MDARTSIIPRLTSPDMHTKQMRLKPPHLLGFPHQTKSDQNASRCKLNNWQSEPHNRYLAPGDVFQRCSTVQSYSAFSAPWKQEVVTLCSFCPKFSAKWGKKIHLLPPSKMRSQNIQLLVLDLFKSKSVKENVDEPNNKTKQNRKNISIINLNLFKENYKNFHKSTLIQLTAGVNPHKCELLKGMRFVYVGIKKTKLPAPGWGWWPFVWDEQTCLWWSRLSQW